MLIKSWNGTREPIRVAILPIVSDLKQPVTVDTALSRLIRARGGRYREAVVGTSRDTIIFNVFSNVTLKTLSLGSNGTSVRVEFDAPPGKARSRQPRIREEYWDQLSKKTLMQGTLVALLWKDSAASGTVEVYLGAVTSTTRDLTEAAKKPSAQERVCLDIAFFDTAMELRAIEALQNHGADHEPGTWVLIETPVFYEGIRPFLEALKKDPERLPFTQYLRHQSKEELSQTIIKPPRYSRAPGFSFELADLFDKDAGVESLKLTTSDPDSVGRVKSWLQRSRLDPSQADAVVDSLTREVSLIQG